MTIKQSLKLKKGDLVELEGYDFRDVIRVVPAKFPEKYPEIHVKANLKGIAYLDVLPSEIKRAFTPKK